VALLLAALGAAGCGSAGARSPAVQRAPSPVIAAPAGAPVRVAVIVLENEEYGQIIGSSQAPFLNALARRYALATESFAITHPSLPNYIALTDGTTTGIASDCTSCSVAGAGLGGQLAAAHVSWRAFMQSLPRPCFLGASAGEYAKKHDPFAYYDALVSRRSQCARIVPIDRLYSDERTGALPRFSWISPNLCDDMHDCAPAVGDRFLSRLLPPLLRALGPHGLLIVTFDEGTSDAGCCRLAGGGHIVTILAGGLARAHARLSTPVDHYSVLQTIEDLLKLPRLRGADCACTPSLAPLLRISPRVRGRS
jgi:hypothetical protein